MNENDVKLDSGGITNWRVNFMKSQSIMRDIASNCRAGYLPLKYWADGRVTHSRLVHVTERLTLLGKGECKILPQKFLRPETDLCQQLEATFDLSVAACL